MLYTIGDKTREAQCARYLHHKDAAPSDGYEGTISTSQPTEALKHWWEAIRQYEGMRRLEPGFPMTEHIQGNTATLQIDVESPYGQQHGDRDGFHCFPNGNKETWTIELETVLAGGWKIRSIHIGAPVLIIPFTGSPCDKKPAA